MIYDPSGAPKQNGPTTNFAAKLTLTLTSTPTQLISQQHLTTQQPTTNFVYQNSSLPTFFAHFTLAVQNGTTREKSQCVFRREAYFG